MKLPKVMIAMPVGSGSVPWATAVSLISTIRVLDKEGLPFRIESTTGCSIVQWARSVIAGKFLASDCSHIMWIDSDVVWTPNDFIRLLGFGANLDVVGATYAIKSDKPNHFFLNPLPDEKGNLVVNGFGCIKIRSIGLGFTLCKRAVVEKVAAGKPIVHDDHNGASYPDLFRVDRVVDANGRATPRGEDVAFFDDVREAGFDVWLDPSVKLGHCGMKVYSGDPITALGLEDFAKEVPA